MRPSALLFKIPGSTTWLTSIDEIHAAPTEIIHIKDITTHKNKSGTYGERPLKMPYHAAKLKYSMVV